MWYVYVGQELLFCREIKGYSKEVNLTYNPNNEDEVEDLYCLLKDIQVSNYYIKTK